MFSNVIKHDQGAQLATRIRGSEREGERKRGSEGGESETKAWERIETKREDGLRLEREETKSERE